MKKAEWLAYAAEARKQGYAEGYEQGKRIAKDECKCSVYRGTGSTSHRYDSPRARGWV